VRRLYGTSPLHLLAHVVLLPLSVWGLLQALQVSSAKAAAGIAVWLAGAVIVHDLLVLPLYSLADRALRRVARGARVNYVRIPAALSLLMLVVFWGTIGGRGEGVYHRVSGRSFEGYAARWLLVTAALFAGSGLLYLTRRRSAPRRPRGR
jgi:hypothetical protein